MIVEVDEAAKIVTKRAESGPEAARLRREAAVLDAARHPGTTELLALDDAGMTLRVRAVAGRPLTQLSGLSDGQVAALGVAVATTLADLHDLGIVHGAVAADHVLVGPTGRPVLCGLGYGGSARDDDRPDPAEDVAGLAAVLESMLARDGRRGHDPLRRLLARAARPHTRRRPSARRLAVALVEQVPGAVLPVPRGTPDTGPDTWPGARPHGEAASARVRTVGGGHRVAGCTRWSTGLAAGALGILLIVVLVLLRTWAGHGGQTLPPAGGDLTTGSGRYRIGRPGDRVVTGRWRCGSPLAALLRPETGQVWVFDAWASPEHPVPARLVARVAGAISLVVDAAAAGAPGCDGLSVTRSGGPPVSVDLGETAPTGTARRQRTN